MKINLPTPLIFLLLITCLTKPSSAQNTNSQKVRAIEAAIPVLDKYFKDYAEKNHLPGLAYGLVADGKLIHQATTGYINLDKKTPVTPQSNFHIASMTKSFTAMAILKLRDEGKLKLDDPAYLYIPELKNQKYLTTDASPITVRQLLIHAAGFPEDNPWGDRQLAVTDETMLQMIKKG